jgi:hypothetical protein
MRDLYPGYDVLAKRNSLSWNEQTRAVIDRRLAIRAGERRFFTAEEWPTLRALCDRIVPQPAGRAEPVPLAEMVDEKMHANRVDGYRHGDMPTMGEAWRRGLAALDAEARLARGARFHELPPSTQDGLVRDMENDALRHEEWRGMSSGAFFRRRVLTDIVKAYYAHPTAWSEIGWGGPASPRGYVRMDFDRRDPWEAAEAKPGREAATCKENRRVGR